MILAIDWTDPGTTYGPVLGDGYLGLRIMGHTREIRFTQLRVHRVKPE